MTRPVPQLLSRPSPEEVELEGDLEELDRTIGAMAFGAVTRLSNTRAVRSHGGIDKQALADLLVEQMEEATYAARKSITRRLEGEDETPR